jgi:hypothetical protein
MKPSGYAARLGRNGKKAEWSYRLDPSNSEERCTGGGMGSVLKEGMTSWCSLSSHVRT